MSDNRSVMLLLFVGQIVFISEAIVRTVIGVVVEKILHLVLVQIHFTDVIVHEIIIYIMFTLLAVGGGLFFCHNDHLLLLLL